MARQVRRYGRLTDGPHEGAGGRKPATEEDVCRGALESRDRRGGPDKKMVAPSQRREMAQWAVAQRSATIRLACQAFGISQTCYRYRAKLDAENAVVADWLVRLTNNQRNWGFGQGAGGMLEAERPHLGASRTDEDEARRGAGLGKGRVLAQKTIPRMNCLR